MNNYQSDFFVFKSVIAGIAILYFVMISFSGTKKTEPLEEKMIYSDQVISVEPFRMSM
jgi:hypothetical protein